MDENIAAGFVGLSQGIEKGIQNAYNIDRQGQKDRLELQKYAEETQYKQQQRSMDQEKHDSQMELMKAQLKQLKDSQTQTKFYNAFNGFTEDGNTRWFNQALQEDPSLGKLFGGVTRLDPLNSNSSEDIRMFQDIGGVNMNDPAVLKRYLKTTDNQGNTQLVDMFSAAKSHGVWKTWSDEKLKTQEMEAKIAETNAKSEYYSGRANPSNVPYDIKTAQYEADLSLKIADGSATTKEQAEYQALQNKRGGTGIAISNIASSGEQNHLVAPPGPGFNISNMEGQAKVATQKQINTLELTPSGKDLSANMRKMFSEGIGASVGLTNQLADLAKNKNVTTDTATKFLTEAKAFLPEELRDVSEADLNDVKFRQSFMTVASVYLKLQSGLTVSDAERQDFLASMGSLNSNVKVNMSGLRNKFSTIVDNYSSNRVLNPDLYDYKYSKQEMEMRNILQGLDDFVKPTGKEVKSSPLDKKKVDLGNKIFFGGN